MLLPLRYPLVWFVGGLVLMALVLLLTLAPIGGFRPLGIVDDKTAHFLAFGVMMLWFCGVFRVPTMPLAAVGLLLFGALIELLQSYLPYRSAELADLLYDAGGIATGWIIGLLGLRHWTTWVEAALPIRSG